MQANGFYSKSHGCFSMKRDFYVLIRLKLFGSSKLLIRIEITNF